MYLRTEPILCGGLSYWRFCLLAGPARMCRLLLMGAVRLPLRFMWLIRINRVYSMVNWPPARRIGFNSSDKMGMPLM